MTTENQIQVNLQKFKSKKQNLGIVEDILTQTYSELADLQSQMKNIYLQLDDNINSTFDNISSEIEGLGTDANNYKEQYTVLFDKFYGLIDDLGQYGDFSTDVVDEMTTNLDDNVQRVFNVQSEIMGNF